MIIPSVAQVAPQRYTSPQAEPAEPISRPEEATSPSTERSNQIHAPAPGETDSSAPAPKHTFLTLDALRGFAALAVLDFHTGHFFGVDAFPHGYLAVDFFLMLSGFVLSLAYQEKLDAGWPTFTFFKVRVARLYPLYLVGLLLGCSFHLLQAHFGHSSAYGRIDLPLLALGLLMLPALPGIGSPLSSSFPFNPPSWTLFYEIAINIFHAVFLRRRTTRLLLIVLATSGTIFACYVLRQGDANIGAFRNQLLSSFARILFSYVFGMILFRVWKRYGAKIQIPVVLPIGLLFLSLALGRHHEGHSIFQDLATICVVFPVLLLAGACSTPPGRWTSLFRMLGTSSYAMYVIHGPVAEFFNQAWVRLRGRPVAADAPWGLLLYLLLTVVLALALDAVYDEPARAFLRRTLVGSKSKRPRIAETV